jgi:hypothetical protein
MSLQQLPWDQGKWDLEILTNKVSDSEAAYSQPLINDYSSFVDINRNLLTDPLRKAFHTFSSQNFVVEDSVRVKLSEHLAEQGVAPSHLPLRSQVASRFVNRAARFLISLAGGSFMLVPIIMMNFVDSQNMRVLVAVLFILVSHSFFHELFL